MPTASDVRKIALALDGVSEIDHHGRPAWRTAKRIFAVMRPDGLFLHLQEERKPFLFAADPDVFVKYMWGKTAEVIVQIDKLAKTELKALIHEAWTNTTAKPSRSTSPPRKPATSSKTTAR